VLRCSAEKYLYICQTIRCRHPQDHYQRRENLKSCKIWRFHGCNDEEYCLLGYKNPVCTSQETHYSSATEPSRLLLFKIWCFDGFNNEERCLLGYRNPIRTSQEAHYSSATEPSRLLLFKICCFDGCNNEEHCLLGYDDAICSYPRRQHSSSKILYLFH
jgi:hypothetical protein